jgi:hypothetical protein
MVHLTGVSKDRKRECYASVIMRRAGRVGPLPDNR